MLSALILSAALTGCGAGPENSTPEALIRNYLSAVKARDYEAVWSMLPTQIQEYAVAEGVISDKEDGIDYIYYAVNDYYWLAELDLPSRKSFDFKVDEVYTEDAQRIQKFLKEQGVRLVVEEAQFVSCTVTADDIQQEADFFVVQSDGRWYMISVAGDDEVFEY